MTKSQNQPYWASVEPKEISCEILEKVEKYYEFLSLTGRTDLYRRSWGYYYNARMSNGRLLPAGEQGELTTVTINHFRNLLLHLETLTISQRPAYEPRASNSDVKSQSQVILASGLLDYYSREKKMERYIKSGVKNALIFGDGFCRVEWDATSGDIYGKTELGAPIYEGDLKFSTYSPFDCIRNVANISAGETNDEWFILRDFQNKYSLAAKFPALEDDILSDSADMLDLIQTTTLNALALEESDMIPVYTLLHKATPALPHGRYTVCLGNDTVLMDGPIPYDECHVYRIAPENEEGTVFGYTVAFDLLPIQELLNQLYSSVASNQCSFAVQNILVPKGGDFSVTQLAGGMNQLDYDPKVGKPEALQLTQSPPEVFNFIQMLEKVQEIISGVNSVARGNPEASLKSGAALALVQSMAIQFSMSLQQSYAQLVEDLGTACIKILQTFAAVPRVAAITGKSNRPLMREFSGADLGEINRVMVDLGNPLSRTTAGKVNLAEALIQNNMIENADQYIQVVTTGRLEPIIEGKQAQLLLIKGENEGLAEGQPQRALITDNHAKHILEHTTVLANPEIRQDPNNPIVQVTLDHIQEHMNLMSNPMSQQLLSILHQEIVPGAPPQPTAQDGGTADMLNANPAIVEAANGVGLPNAPQPPQGTDQRSAEIIQQQGEMIAPGPQI